MKFRDYFSIKHILFAIGLFAVMMLFAVNQSNNSVKVYFEDTEVQATSAKYSISIPYDMIVSAELVTLPAEGERVLDAYDDGTLRAGIWQNEVWGEYYIVADLDVKTCIEVTLDDGRIFVFSRKNEDTTAEIFAELQSHLE